MSMAHAKLGASSAHRWSVCAGSVKACEGLPNKSSPFAEEGTAAHDLAELALTIDNTALDTFKDQNMAGFVRMYVEHVQHLAADADLCEIEARVSYQNWVSGGFGTADAVVLRGNHLHVVDLKYGMGVQVHAENNPQGMLYALGAYSEVGHIADIKTITITIVQPRLDHISEWQISISDLLKWGEWISQRAEATQADDAPRIAGNSQCKFCLAKHNCPSLLDLTTKTLLTEFDNLDDLSTPDALTDDQIGAVLASKSLIEGWLLAVQSHVTERLENGEGFDGFKLVAGRSSRKWYDEGETTEFLTALLGDKAMTQPKLISPAQAEKVLGAKRKGEVAELIVKSEGKPTLAPESDKRPAINFSVADF